MVQAVDGISVELLAGRPELVAQLGQMTWQEWGYGAGDPAAWADVIAREAGRDGLPVSLVAVDAAGDAVGKVGLGESDGDLSEAERGDRGPWILGMIVRERSRGQRIGRLLLASMEARAAGQGYRQLWVATGEQAVGFYQRCGWRIAGTLRPVAIDRPTMILTRQLSRAGVVEA